MNTNNNCSWGVYGNFKKLQSKIEKENLKNNNNYSGNIISISDHGKGLLNSTSLSGDYHFHINDCSSKVSVGDIVRFNIFTSNYYKIGYNITLETQHKHVDLINFAADTLNAPDFSSLSLEEMDKFIKERKTNKENKMSKEQNRINKQVEEILQEDILQEEILQEEILQEDKLQEDILQEDILQEDILQEDKLQEDILQEDKLQEDILQEDKILQKVELKELKELKELYIEHLKEFYTYKLTNKGGNDGENKEKKKRYKKGDTEIIYKNKELKCFGRVWCNNGKSLGRCNRSCVSTLGYCENHFLQTENLGFPKYGDTRTNLIPYDKCVSKKLNGKPFTEMVKEDLGIYEDEEKNRIWLDIEKFVWDRPNPKVKKVGGKYEGEENKKFWVVTGEDDKGVKTVTKVIVDRDNVEYKYF